MHQPKSRVLLVDDVAASAESLAGLLEGIDAEIVLASSLFEARAACTSEIAVAVVTSHTGGLTGADLARGLSRDDRSLPILVLTRSEPTEEELVRTYESGAIDVLTLPLRSEILRSKIRVFVEVHRTRQALATEAEAHRQTLAELDAFSYSVSHDLRAPLRAVEGFTRVIAEDYQHVLDETAQRHLRRICNGTERMKSIIDDLLRLAQISRRHPTFAPVDVSALANEIVGDVRASERRKDVVVTVQVGMTAEADERLLRIALENLVRNAWKFTRDEEAPRIEIGQRRDVFHVRDNGIGFDPSQGAQLFQPFVRLHGSDFEGTGIGLSIVQRIVSHHGGRIDADGMPGRGATFSFTLDGEPASSARPGLASVRRTSQVVPVRDKGRADEGPPPRSALPGGGRAPTAGLRESPRSS